MQGYGMGSRQAITGEVVHVGAILQQGGQEDCSLLESVVFKDRAGTITRFTGLVVPGNLHWMLKPGLEGKFELLHITYPKPLGSYIRSFLTEITSEKASGVGREGVRKWISSSKGACFHYLWYGVVLLPAFGFGVLLWICAFRLLRISVPSTSDDGKGGA